MNIEERVLRPDGPPSLIHEREEVRGCELGRSGLQREAQQFGNESLMTLRNGYGPVFNYEGINLEVVLDSGTQLGRVSQQLPRLDESRQTGNFKDTRSGSLHLTDKGREKIGESSVTVACPDQQRDEELNLADLNSHDTDRDITGPTFQKIGAEGGPRKSGRPPKKNKMTKRAAIQVSDNPVVDKCNSRVGSQGGRTLLEAEEIVIVKLGIVWKFGTGDLLANKISGYIKTEASIGFGAIVINARKCTSDYWAGSFEILESVWVRSALMPVLCGLNGKFQALAWIFSFSSSFFSNRTCITIVIHPGLFHDHFIVFGIFHLGRDRDPGFWGLCVILIREDSHIKREERYNFSQVAGSLFIPVFFGGAVKRVGIITIRQAIIAMLWNGLLNKIGNKFFLGGTITLLSARLCSAQRSRSARHGLVTLNTPVLRATRPCLSQHDRVLLILDLSGCDLPGYDLPGRVLSGNVELDMVVSFLTCPCSPYVDLLGSVVLNIVVF
ncbi:hypothetical protein Dimus_014293 [Dionaea muscipula]